MAFMALLLLVIFIVIMLTGIPVGYGMGALTVISFLLLGGDLSMIPQKLFSGIDTYTYVCILLFILSADIMTVGGITKAIVTFCDKLVGHVRGGLAHVNLSLIHILPNDMFKSSKSFIGGYERHSSTAAKNSSTTSSPTTPLRYSSQGGPYASCHPAFSSSVGI